MSTIRDQDGCLKSIIKSCGQWALKNIYIIDYYLLNKIIQLVTP